jgi:manganese-dependent inorganic pyrophosphatase
LNKETEYVLNYFDIEAPELIDDVEDGAQVILVDHNSPSESVDNLENAKILKVVDHHKLALETSYPLFYRAEPVGCTETVLFKLYKENGVEVTKEIASLMLSAIISDTLLLKSPTTTEDDVEAVKELAEIAEIDYESYGLEMLKAGTDLSDFSIEEILDLDAKQIDFGDVKSIINQVNTASIPDVLEMQEDLENGIQKIIDDENLDIFMLLITDIVNSNSEVLVLGSQASLVEVAYDVTLEDNHALLEGVVSRKKQVVPIMTETASKL